MTLVTLEGGAVLDEFHGRFAVWTGQDLQEFRIDGHDGLHFTSSSRITDYSILN